MERAVYDRMAAMEDRHWWFEARRRILAGQIAAMALTPDAQILEVGCGTGGNLAMLARFGAVTGLEPDADARAFAAEKSGLPVVDGSLPSGLPFDPARFDLIAALDVIEHVDEDAATVASLRPLLKPGGWVLATVPAYRWMWSGHDAAHHHQRRYARAAFRRLFEDAGFEVRKATYFNTLLFPAVAAVRLAKTALGRTGADEDAIPAAPLNGLLTSVFAAERGWLRSADFPFGVSILLTARRPL
jgi:SAM-dependent methyltransferase